MQAASRRILGSLLYKGDDLDDVREKQRAFGELSIPTEITGGVDTYWRLWRVIEVEPAYINWRAHFAAIMGEPL